MEEKFEFTSSEWNETQILLDKLKISIGRTLKPDDEEKIRSYITYAIQNNQIQRDVFGLNPILNSLQTAEIAVEEIGMKRDGILAILLYNSVIDGYADEKLIEKLFGENVAHIIHGLARIHELYKKNPVVESENFRNLLISFAEDMRVILIMIADRMNLMRQIRDTTKVDAKREVSSTTAAPRPSGPS